MLSKHIQHYTVFPQRTTQPHSNTSTRGGADVAGSQSRSARARRRLAKSATLRVAHAGNQMIQPLSSRRACAWQQPLPRTLGAQLDDNGSALLPQLARHSPPAERTTEPLEAHPRSCPIASKRKAWAPQNTRQDTRTAGLSHHSCSVELQRVLACVFPEAPPDDFVRDPSTFVYLTFFE